MDVFTLAAAHSARRPGAGMIGDESAAGALRCLAIAFGVLALALAGLSLAGHW